MSEKKYPLGIIFGTNCPDGFSPEPVCFPLEIPKIQMFHIK